MSSNIAFERRALAIFNSLVELDAAEQATQLTLQCAEDEALQSRVEALLTLDAAISGAPSALTQAAILTPAPVLTNGTQVGNYRIVGSIGIGGMGAVYKAERSDGTFERTVAIKFLHTSLWSDALHQRFDEERRIMGRLHHPNITQLLDGGAEQGQPYLVMEYVEGQPFTFDEGIERRTQLQRFADVCGAVAHAHNNLILHRDIKPDNVLIDNLGKPKLLDFGIAKLIDSVGAASPGLTQQTALPMTPQYTAPECLAGQPASVASDVYALGLLLFEVVSGHRPYELDSSNLLAAANIANKQVQTKGLTSNKDLDLVLATALRLEPERRYSSASALQQDIENILGRRPIAARADKLLYTTTRFVQRHLLGSTVSVVAVIALVAMLVSTLAASRESERQRLVAEQNLSTAEYSTSFLVQTLSGASPVLGAKPLTTIDEALAAAEERLQEEIPSDAYTRMRLFAALGIIFSGREDTEKFLDYLARAEGLLLDDPSLPRAVETLASIAEAYHEAGQPKLGLAAAERAIELRGGSEEPDHLDFAKALLIRASIRQVAGDNDGMRADIEQARRILDTQEVDVSYERAQAAMALAHLEANFGDFKTAEEHVGEALEHLNQLGLLYSANGVQARFMQASLLTHMSRQQEGFAKLDKMMEEMRTLLGPTHARVLWSTASIGSMYNSMGLATEGVAVMEPLLATVESKFEPTDELYAYFIAKLGYAMCHSQRYGEGLALLDKALVSRRLVYPPNNWNIPDAEFAIGYCHMHMGQDAEAVLVLNQAKVNFTAIFGPEHAQIKGIDAWLTEIAERQP